MASRLKLHEEFCEILGTGNAYFQPPASLRMTYDAIRYGLSGLDARHANNCVYKKVNRYDGVVITLDPDTEIPHKLLDHFQMCSLGSSYIADNLYHFPFTLYY